MAQRTTTYYESGQIKEELYCIEGEFSRIDGPSIVQCSESGKVSYEAYYLNNKWHRLDGPARIYYYEPRYEEYWIDHIFLANFEKYGKDKLLEYVQVYPYLFSQIETLARHNKWLNEEQLLLLKSFELFKN